MNRDLFAASGVGGGVVEATPDPYFKSTTLLLSGDGTNGAQNNTFVDSSTNNATITRSGTPTQGSFSPFSQTGWSGYFDGSSYISVPDSTAFTMGSGDFTLEAWVYLTTTSGVSRVIIGTCDAAGSAGSMSFVLGVNASNNATFAIGYAGALYTSTNTATVPTNQWVHIAGVRNGGGIYAYLNGIQSTSNTSMASLAITDSTQVVAIGRNGAYNGEYVTGYISNARIVKGTAVYTGAFTPPTAPLTATQAAGTNIAAITGTATSLLTLQDNRFKDNALTPNTITVAGTPSVQAFSPFAPAAAYSAAVVGGSMYFGTTDSLSIPSSASLTPQTLFTFECWLYPTVTQGTTTGIFVANTTNGIQFAYYGSSGLGLATKGNAWQFNGSVLPIVGQWNHVAVCRGGTGTNQCSIFLNGVRVANGTAAASFVQSAYEISSTQAGGTVFQGYISNARFVNDVDVYGYSSTTYTPPTAPLTAVSGTALLLNATNAGIFDSTGKNDLITVGDARVSTAITKYGTGAIYFDGTGDYLAMPASINWMFGTGDFTVEFWINTAGANSQILSLVGGTAAGNWQVSLYGGSIYWQSARNTTDTYVVSSSAISNSAWHHVAYCRTSNALKVYFDGVAQGAGINDTTNYNISSVLNIGYSSSYFTGYLDDLRITKYARYPGSAFPTKAMIGQ